MTQALILCEVCGAPFNAWPSANRRFCSKAHSMKARAIARAATALSRFNALVSEPNANGCRIWIGRMHSEQGYGTFYFEGQARRSHVVSWMMGNGPVPDGMVVMHSCDTPPCVALEHLSVGTCFDNIADRQAKGRQAHGTGNGKAKLNDDKVRAIRAAVGDPAKIAAEFGVGPEAIRQVRLGKTWRHVV